MLKTAPLLLLLAATPALALQPAAPAPRPDKPASTHAIRPIPRDGFGALVELVRAAVTEAQAGAHHDLVRDASAALARGASSLAAVDLTTETARALDQQRARESSVLQPPCARP